MCCLQMQTSFQATRRGRLVDREKVTVALGGDGALPNCRSEEIPLKDFLPFRFPLFFACMPFQLEVDHSGKKEYGRKNMYQQSQRGA